MILENWSLTLGWEGSQNTRINDTKYCSGATVIGPFGNSYLLLSIN